MIYFLRHGMDDESFVGGWSNVSLTEEGIYQVKAAIPFLQELPIKRIICSDVKRAQETAEIINKVLNVPIDYDTRLRELDKGDVTGITTEEADQIFPNRHNLTINDKYPNGEAMIDLYNRVKDLLPYFEGLDDVLIVTHRGVINMVYFICNDKQVDMNKKQFGVTHASIHEADIKKKVIRRIY